MPEIEPKEGAHGPADHRLVERDVKGKEWILAQVFEKGEQGIGSRHTLPLGGAADPMYQDDVLFAYLRLLQYDFETVVQPVAAVRHRDRANRVQAIAAV